MNSFSNLRSLNMSETQMQPLGSVNGPSTANNYLINVGRPSLPPPFPTQYHENMSVSHYKHDDYLNGLHGLGGYEPYERLGCGLRNYTGYGYINNFNGHCNLLSPEDRLIRIALEGSRPTFQSIESLVGTVSSISNMLESTYLAITTSFRAILSVAANVGQLKGVFAQLWTTIAVFRGLKWIYKKLLYALNVSSTYQMSNFKEAFALAEGLRKEAAILKHEQSSWPVAAFIGFIIIAPYLISKLFNSATNSALQESITTSFRAILSVAANVGQLKGVFAQLWTTIAVFRGLKWIYKKLLYALNVSSTYQMSNFKEAFALAEGLRKEAAILKHEQSSWPVAAFIGFIIIAPYLISKLFNSATNSALQESKNPETWTQPIQSIAIYNFQPRNKYEIAMSIGQKVFIAPKEVQNIHCLMNTGWALASLDGRTSGLVPIAFVQEQSIKS